MLIDTHIHLQDNQYKKDTTEVLYRAAEIGVSAMVIPGTNLEDSIEAVEVAERFSQGPCQIYAAVGFHPTETHLLNDESIHIIRSLAKHSSVVAIGEIGLDYYWPAKPNRSWVCAEPEIQRQALQIQLSLASELSLPVIIHNRDADKDIFAALRSWYLSEPRNNAVLHSYSSGSEYIDQVTEYGFKIGIGGLITYKKAADLRAVVKRVPLQNLLLETDGPYQAPSPHRGKRNEPQYVKLIAERIAEERGQNFSEVADITSQNALSFFKLKL